MLRRALATSLVILGLLAVPARAGVPDPPQPWTPITDQQTYSDLVIAWSYWGALPACPDGLRVYRADVPGTAEGEAQQLGCTIWLDPSTVHGLKRWYYCQLIAHEYGHLLGVDHSTDPRNLMHPRLGRRGAVPACGRLRH